MFAVKVEEIGQKLRICKSNNNESHTVLRIDLHNFHKIYHSNQCNSTDLSLSY